MNARQKVVIMESEPYTLKLELDIWIWNDLIFSDVMDFGGRDL